MAELTREQVLAMTAGPEMNWHVATKVLGWGRACVGWMAQNPATMYRGYGGCEIPPDYSADIAAAWEVVGHLRSLGYLVKVQEMPDGIPWLANRDDEPDMPVLGRAYVALSYIAGRTSEKPEEVRRYVHEHVFAIEDTSAPAISRAALLTTLTEAE